MRQQLSRLNRPCTEVYKKILYSFVESGRILARHEIALLVDDIDAVLNELAVKGLIICDAKHNPSGAYPFTMQQRPHKIKVNDFTVHAMCALDALAISPMFNLPTDIESQCAISKMSIHIIQHGKELHNADDLHDVFFAINWNAASTVSCCADSLCNEMIFIKGQSLAKQWLEVENHNRELFTLTDAIDFAAAFFAPLLP